MALLQNFDDGQNEQNWSIRKYYETKKIIFFIIRITPKTYQHTSRVRTFL